MSIIHDALKKLQQGGAKPEEKKPQPLFETPVEPLFSNAPAPKPAARAIKPAPQNTFKTLMAFCCALLIFAGAFFFLYKQVDSYFPEVTGWAVSAYKKILRIKPDIKSAEKPEPLAQIIPHAAPPAPPAAAAPQAPAPVKTTAVINEPRPEPETLNIHGVMANGKNNLVLINDQVYQEGDEVAGIKILKIGLDYITVDNNGQEEKIRVKN